MPVTKDKILQNLLLLTMDIKVKVKTALNDFYTVSEI